MDPSAISIRQLNECNSSDTRVTRRLRRIYVDAFPPEERVPESTLADRINKTHCFVHVAYAHRDPLGFAIWADLLQAQAIIIEYLAVDAPHREHGVGALLLTSVIDLAKRQSRLGVILEVQPLDQRSAELDDRARRIAFYMRHGARVVSDAPDYAIPDFTGGPPLPMTLLWIPTGGPSHPRGDMLRHLITDIFSVSYGRTLTDGIVLGNLANL